MAQDDKLRPMPLDEPVADEEVALLEELAKRDKVAEETMRQILIERYGEEEARKQSPHVWRD
jgi:hypothetical protein